MNAPQPGQLCRSGAITSSRSGRARADVRAIPHLHRCRDHNAIKAQSANFAGLAFFRTRRLADLDLLGERLRILLEHGRRQLGKLGTAFGEEAPNRLQAAVDRERTFADTFSKVTKGSKSTPSALSAMRLEAKAPGSLNLSGATSLGAGLQASKALVFNPLARALLTNDDAAMETEMARALKAVGATRDQILGALARVEARRAAVASFGGRLESAVRGTLSGATPATRSLVDPTATGNRLMGAARGTEALVGVGGR